MSAEPRSVDDWFDRAPVAVVGLALATALTAVLTVFDLVVHDGVEWGGTLVRFAVFAVLYTVSSSWSRRRKRMAGVPAADRAVRTGELPADADPGVLRAGLLHVKRSLRRSGWVVGALLVGFVVLVAVVSPPERQRWLGAVLVAVVLGGVLLFVRLRTRRIDRLLDQLHARAVE